jgi:predicted membrane channel-forming protein YqfA (hemolysin III family)
MEFMSVARWLFWAGVLVLIAAVVFSTLWGQDANPPYGTDWNLMPLFLIAALVLLFASVVFRSPSGSEPETEEKSPPSEPQ